MLLQSDDLKDLQESEKLLILVEAVGLIRHLSIRTYKNIGLCQAQSTKNNLNCVIKSIQRFNEAAGLDVANLINQSLKVLSKKQGKEESELQLEQLFRVDLIFRLYVPLFALLKQTDQMESC